MTNSDGSACWAAESALGSDRNGLRYPKAMLALRKQKELSKGDQQIACTDAARACPTLVLHRGRERRRARQLKIELLSRLVPGSQPRRATVVGATLGMASLPTRAVRGHGARGQSRTLM